MSNVPVLIDTIIRLKRQSQADVAEKSQIHRSNLSRFLSGDIDIRLSSLISILESLDIRFDEILQKEIDTLLGKKASSNTVGEALETLLSQADPITSKTVLESLTNKIKQKNKQTDVALNVVNDYKSKIKLMRKNA